MPNDKKLPSYEQIAAEVAAGKYGSTEPSAAATPLPASPRPGAKPESLGAMFLNALFGSSTPERDALGGAAEGVSEYSPEEIIRKQEMLRAGINRKPVRE